MKFRSLLPAGWALACGLLAAPGPAAAYTYIESVYGTPLTSLSAKGMAMGGALTAIPNGSFSLISNPAMLSWESGSVADATVRVARADETRFNPIFDSFDQYLKDTAVSENPSTYIGVNGGAVWKPCPRTDGFAFAGGFYERYNAEFNFVDERRNGDGTDKARRDKLQATQYITTDHAIYSVSGGASYRRGGLAAGLALHYYFGNLSYLNQVVPGPVARPITDGPSLTHLTRDLSGLGASFGLAADVDPRIRLGASYEVPVTLGADWRVDTAAVAVPGTHSVSGHATIRYPGRLGFGVAYRPRNVLRTTFSASAERTYWSTTGAHDGTLKAFGAAAPALPLPALRDTWEFNFGVEHVFYNNLPTRFGLFYRQAYSADDVDMAGLTAGTGYQSGRFDFGIGAEVSKRSSRQAALTPRSGSDAKTDNVQDSLLRGVIDVRYHF
ncbi:MAG TPA: outer membrane protein transport protein [Candidatus Saccharimonadales bacterium]|nr:outer membrane protein transport protein [Candidatus Saccharimonadales bacterium]